jgi:hypothetical protein
VLPDRYSICRLPAPEPVPLWALQGAFTCVTRTSSEWSVVCETAFVPAGVQEERDWSVLGVEGPLDFGLIGVIAQLARQLADAAISTFVISTYETDYLLVREIDLGRAVATLRAAGHRVEDPHH